MITLKGIIFGILAIIFGILGLKYNYQIVNFTGRQDWIEDKLGGGTTFVAYKLFAILLVLVGILAATGLINPLLNGILSPLKHTFGG
jgi:hypothetical protein